MKKKYRGTESTKNQSVFLGFLCTNSFLFVLCASVLNIFLSGCLDPEKPMPAIPEPVLQSIEINTYNQATHFYSLTQKKTVASVKITDWDLKLCSQKDKYFIYLNTAKNMRIARYEGKFSDSIDIKKITRWHTDLMKDGKCLTAMGTWGDFSFASPKSYGYTYILDLGYLNFPGEYGYRKIEVLGFANNTYTVKYGMPDDPYGDTLKIEKKGAYNYVYLKMEPKATEVSIEPPAAEWDLVFTQYGLSTQVIQNGNVVDTAFINTDMILMNTTGRQITCDTVKTFDEITFWDAEKYMYTTAMDHIGNRWRIYNASLDQYEVSKKNIYILKNTKNNIYLIELKSVDKSVPGVTKIGFRVKNL